MAYSVTDSSVIFSQGRGAAKVSLEISFDELEKWAKKQKVDTEKLMFRSYLRCCAALKSQFTKVVKNAGGMYGVPKFKDFDAFTLVLRSHSGRTAPMGGMLADRSSVFGGKSGGWYYVGWKDYLKEAAENFQDGVGGPNAEKYFTDSGYRRTWHQKGIAVIPRAYVHNPRRVLPEPFGSHVERHLKDWAKGAFYKELAKQMQKGAAA